MSCFTSTGDLHEDRFTQDHPEKATCAAMFQSMLAPWEGTAPIPFAEDALRQLSAELCILESAMSDANQAEGPLNNTIMRRALVGLQHRARVAAEVLLRLANENPPTATKAERDTAELHEHIDECLDRAEAEVKTMALGEQENWRKEAFPKALAELRAAKTALSLLGTEAAK